MSKKIIGALIFNMLLSSCIKDDLSNCPEQIRVYFSITTPEGADKINPDDVDRMNLYVFNHKGYYLGKYRDEHITDFDADNYYMDCSDLLPGKYRFIAWAGKDERCYNTAPEPFVAGKTKFEEALLILEHSNDLVTEKVHHLFHSILPATVTKEKVQRFDMPLIQITNTINISTVGYPIDANDYTFEIVDNNCKYLFDRSFVTCPNTTFKYAADCVKDELFQLHSSLNVMRLAADRNTPQLQIYNETSGTLLYPFGSHSSDLIELIMNAYPENDFDHTHTYNITLVFGEPKPSDTHIQLTIYINGWQVRNQDVNF